MLHSVLKCLVDLVNNESSTLASVAMQALGHIGICTPLPPLVIDSAEGDVTVLFKFSCFFGIWCNFLSDSKSFRGDNTIFLYNSAVSTWTLLQKKLSKLLAGDDIKAVQKTVIALGHMCAKESSSSHLTIALDLIFSLSRSKVGDPFR